MERRSSALLCAGFLLILACPFTYLPLFARFPLTRDFPWVNLLLFVAGAGLMVAGLKRACGQPGLHRGKIVGTILGAVSILLLFLFVDGVFRRARQLPPSKGAPQVGQKAPDFALRGKDGSPTTLSALLSAPVVSGSAPLGTRGVVLIFYRGHWCPLCNSELRSFEQRLDEFEARGVRLVAISVDPPESSREHCRKQGYTYTFLSDPEAEAIGRYDLVHAGGGPDGQAIARPAEFVIDSSRTIRWVNLTESVIVRARPERVLKAIDELGMARSPPPGWRTSRR